MKKIFVFLLIIIISSLCFISASATESNVVAETENKTEFKSEVANESSTDLITESAWVNNDVTEPDRQTTGNSENVDNITESNSQEKNTYETDTSAILDSEVVSEVIDVIENSDSKAEAIIAIVEMLGVSTEEAENIINAIISVGDEYFGQSDAWIGFKNDIQENIKFWILVIVCVAAVITIAGVVFIFLARVNPELHRAMFGMTDAIKICKKQHAEVSQTLENLKKYVIDSAYRGDEYKLIIEEKEELIQKLLEKISNIEIKANKKSRNMVLAELYNLQILKLICSRTALPVADKAAIDLWYTKATESLKNELSEDDIKKMNDIATTLEDCHE